MSISPNQQIRRENAVEGFEFPLRPWIGWGTVDHVALLTPEVLLRAGLTPAVKVFDLKDRHWRSTEEARAQAAAAGAMLATGAYCRAMPLG